jgi:hypothetical protein
MVDNRSNHHIPWFAGQQQQHIQLSVSFGLVVVSTVGISHEETTP